MFQVPEVTEVKSGVQEKWAVTLLLRRQLR